jgi:hypothetical protein
VDCAFGYGGRSSAVGTTDISCFMLSPPQRIDVGHAERRNQKCVNELRAAVAANVSLFALPGVVYLAIVFTVLVLSRCRRANNRGIHDRAVRARDAVALECSFTGKQLL